MSATRSWRPTATAEQLRVRAETLAGIRTFFAERGVLEVETPALSRAGNTDPHLEPLPVTVGCLGDAPMYLRTSPELEMKRLLAAGSGDIFQICRVFRDGELGRWHQPEFTILEWYRVGWDEAELMTEVEALLRRVLEPCRALGPTLRLSYREAITSILGPEAADEPSALQRRLEELGVDVPGALADDELLDLALSTAVIPRLDPEGIVFVYDYPPTQAALARIKPTTPPVAARFEAFLGGLELANGFHELTDPSEQRARFQAEGTRRERAGRPVPPLDEAFLAALEHGLPACAGVALGIDRLIAAAAGAERLAETVSFAHSG